MEYLNIPLAVVAGIEFIGSPPLARATWLSLQIFCTKSENGGRIANCRDWGDHTWGQIAGLKRREVHTASKLWAWEGDDLVVWAYNLESEAKVKALRSRGRRGGMLSGQSRRLGAASPDGEADASAFGEADASSQSEALLERKGKERKEKEENSLSPARAAGSAGCCSVQEALAYAQAYNAGQGLAAGRRIESHVVTLWHDDREKVGWVTHTGVPIVDWQADLRGYAQRYTQNEQRPQRGEVRPLGRGPVKLSTAPKGGF